MDDVLTVGVLCGQCGSDEVHFDACPECEYAQASVCFGCGATFRLSGYHEEGCSHANA